VCFKELDGFACSLNKETVNVVLLMNCVFAAYTVSEDILEVTLT